MNSIFSDILTRVFFCYFTFRGRHTWSHLLVNTTLYCSFKGEQKR